MVSKSNSREYLLFLAWPLVAAGITIFLEETGIVTNNFFVSIVVFLVLPSIYLSLKIPNTIPRTFIFSTLPIIPTMVAVEYIGHISQAWSFPPSVFSFAVLDLVIFEVVLWAFFNTYFIVAFYEYFYDGHLRGSLWKERFGKLVLTIFALFGGFTLLISYLIIEPIPYFYFLFGLVLFALPVIMQITSLPKTKKVSLKILKASLYFVYLSFVYELVAVNYGWWSFLSDSYIGWFSILDTAFPLEELVWWIILFAPAILCSYEFFYDDER